MKKLFGLLLLGLLLWTCNNEEEPAVVNQDNFDRAAMLSNWADNIIIPAYEAYVIELEALARSKDSFLLNSTENNLLNLRDSWLKAYITWQKVSMFEIGKAEQLTLRDYTNIFPTDAQQIEENITGANYNLDLPSTRSQQGFPALDYLLNGSEGSTALIAERFANSQSMRDYLDDLISRLNNLTNQVLDDWRNGYRNVFVSNSGSEASSSVNKFTNDFVFYYEKALRAGKIGIPAGVFSNAVLSDRVEAFYKKDVSKVLLETALEATIDFFNGRHFEGNGSGESLASYLDFLNAVSGGESLSGMINNQFDKTESASQNLQDNFFEEVETNNLAMLNLYDELQANVILLKVDMFQALNIKVDFVDADGD